MKKVFLYLTMAIILFVIAVINWVLFMAMKVEAAKPMAQPVSLNHTTSDTMKMMLPQGTVGALETSRSLSSLFLSMTTNKDAISEVDETIEIYYRLHYSRVGTQPVLFYAPIPLHTEYVTVEAAMPITQPVPPNRTTTGTKMIPPQDIRTIVWEGDLEASRFITLTVRVTQVVQIVASGTLVNDTTHAIASRDMVIITAPQYLYLPLIGTPRVPVVFEREPVRSVLFYNAGEEVSYNEVVNGEGGEVGVFEPDVDVLGLVAQAQWRENAFTIYRMGLVFNTVGLEKPKNVTLEVKILSSTTIRNDEGKGEKVLVYQLAQPLIITPTEALRIVWKQRPPEIVSFQPPDGGAVTLTVPLPPEVITPNETTLLFRLAAEGKDPPPLPPHPDPALNDWDWIDFANVRLIIVK